MTLPRTIRKLSYNWQLRRIAQKLHIGHFARRIYCRLLSSGGPLQVSCLGVNAVLKTHNSNQLAFVDCIFTTEREAIEATLSKLRPGDVFLDVGSHYGNNSSSSPVVPIFHRPDLDSRAKRLRNHTPGKACQELLE